MKSPVEPTNLEMRKIILVIIAVLLCQASVTAQKSSPVKLGLRVAPGIGWMSTSTEGYESGGIRGVIAAGLITDIYFTKNYAISTGFSILFPSGKLNYRDSIPINNTWVAGEVSSTYKLIYFEIPIMLKMKTNQFGKFSFFGQVGFGTGFRLKATAQSDFTPDTGTPESRDTNINNKTKVMRESILAGIGLEYHIDESTGIFAGINYSNSLNNVFNAMNLLTGEELKASPNYVELSIGVLF
jgi:hypothetical protein